VKKNGKIKKRIDLGEGIYLEDKSGANYGGTITYMHNDTLVLNGEASLAVKDMRKIRIDHEKKLKPIDPLEIVLILLGVGLATVGLAATGLETWGNAAIAAVAIGFTPLIFRLIKSISFKKYTYKLGGKYKLVVWDLN
jgi:hypothetical protein